MAASGSLSGLVEYVARGLVDRPDEVHVTELDDGDRTLIELHVAREDLGKVIGKAGRTAHALRLVVGAAAARRNTRARVEIIDQD